jgi:16S rRNA (cytosine1402-N4)-methyltransferase
MTQKFIHVPVMASEVMTYLNLIEGKTAVDVTAGGGGHLKLIADAVGKNGQVIAIDQDQRAHLDDAAGGVAKEYGDRVSLHHASFSELPSVLKKLNYSGVDGILCDAGVSSFQFDCKERGFSFASDGLIDMRMNQLAGISAHDWLKNNNEKTIADTIYLYSGERKSRQIAYAIKSRWPIENSTLALANLITKVVRRNTKYTAIHPATRTFQALRMAVNNEVTELESLLHSLPNLLNINGHAVFISFHSFEDRLVKHGFKNICLKRDDGKEFKIVTKKPVVGTKEEIIENPRARSAKLRAICRTK